MADSSLDLNNPVTRQNWLLEQILQGKTLIAKEAAEELGVSLDTIRRDLIALEQQGALKRVKGGAIAGSVPARPFIDRVKDADTWLAGCQSSLQSLIDGVETLFLDGGTSILKVANAIPVNSQITVITPSPVVATVLLERNIETILLGGRIHPSGAIATGAMTVRAIENISADMAVLGVCGLDSEFGLTADDMAEAEVKFAMANQSRRVVVLASQQKLNKRSPYKVVAADRLDVVVTDATPEQVIGFAALDIEVISV